jgi:integrase
MYAEGDAVLRLPATFTKQARGHDVPVAPTLAAVLDACPIDVRSDLFFPSPRTGQQMSGWNKLLADLVKASGVRFTLHDLRRTFRTGLSRLGVDSELAELAMGHARADLEARYNRDECSTELKKAFDLWAGHVAAVAIPNVSVFD